MRLSVLLSLEQCEILLFYTLWRHLPGRRVAYKIAIWTAKLFAEQREVPLFSSRYPNFLNSQSRTGRKKSLCQKAD